MIAKPVQAFLLLMNLAMLWNTKYVPLTLFHKLYNQFSFKYIQGEYIQGECIQGECIQGESLKIRVVQLVCVCVCVKGGGS